MAVDVNVNACGPAAACAAGKVSPKRRGRKGKAADPTAAESVVAAPDGPVDASSAPQGTTDGESHAEAVETVCGPADAPSPVAPPAAVEEACPWGDCPPPDYSDEDVPPVGDADGGDPRGGRRGGGLPLLTSTNDVYQYADERMKALEGLTFDVCSLLGRRTTVSFKYCMETACAHGGTNDGAATFLWRILGAPAGMDGEGPDARPWREANPLRRREAYLDDRLQEYLFDRFLEKYFVWGGQFWVEDLEHASRYALFRPMVDCVEFFLGKVEAEVRKLQSMRRRAKEACRDQDVDKAFGSIVKRFDEIRKQFDSAGKALQSVRFKKDSLEAATHGAGSLGDSGLNWDRFEATEWTLPVQNGIVTIGGVDAMGNPTPPRHGVPSDRFLRVAPTEYHRNADSPLFLDFIGKIMGYDRALIDYLQVCLGATLCRTRLQAIFFFFGKGSNGKSSLLNVLRHTLGDLYATGNPSLLMETNNVNAEGPTPSLLEAKGRCLFCFEETKTGAVLDAATLKRLSPGSEDIAGRPLYGELLKFTPTATLVLCTNALPSLREFDHAIRRRIACVPFSQIFIPRSDAAKYGLTGTEPSPGEGMFWRDDTLLNRLRQPREIMGAFNWLKQGADRFRLEYGGQLPQQPESVALATEEYFRKQDALEGFYSTVLASHVGEKDERGRPAEDACMVTSSLLFALYVAWADSEGVKHKLTQKALLERIHEKQNSKGETMFPARKTHGIWYTLAEVKRTAAMGLLSRSSLYGGEAEELLRSGIVERGGR